MPKELNFFGYFAEKLVLIQRCLSLFMKKIGLKFLVVLVLFVSCSKEDRDDRAINVVAPSQTSSLAPSDSTSDEPEITLSTEINDFIWDEMNQYYYWQAEVPDLDDSMISNAYNYIEFLNREPIPIDFFYGLLHSDDRNRFSNRPFSWINDDYEALEDQLSGISASDGMKFILYARANGTGIIAAVSYVLPDSDAAEKGVVRGDLFNTINGQEMTTQNYSNLLNSRGMQYSIGLINYDRTNDIVSSRDIEITLEMEENFQEVPIHMKTVIEHGDDRVGYLMLNRFLSSVDSNDDGQADRNFNQEMVDAFAELATENINELVVDLRYNGGGSVLNCVYLASLITGQHTGEIFVKQLWNQKIMDYIDRVNSDANSANDLDFNDYFTNTAPDGSTFSGLNLRRIYVLTSRRTASASEMLINGLKPYMDEVVVIGEATYGKNVGSITLKDYIDVESPRDSLNPRHTYALQPIVIKVANVEDEADYVDGIQPDIEKLEVLTNYGTLGDQNEPMLEAALLHMSNSGKGHSSSNALALPSIVTAEEKQLQQMVFDRPNMKIIDHFYTRKLTQKKNESTSGVQQ